MPGAFGSLSGVRQVGAHESVSAYRVLDAGHTRVRDHTIGNTGIGYQTKWPRQERQPETVDGGLDDLHDQAHRVFHAPEDRVEDSPELRS
jgi:hypothetical protein